MLKNTLAAGYTTIRDAAGLDVGFKRAIEEGLIEGPRLVLSLAIISPIGGIGDAVSPSGLPLDDCCCIPGDPLLPDSVVNSLADVRPVVRRMVRAGADVIKCATTGGASSRAGHGPRDGAFNLDEMQALVDEAHALDRRVMCHALGGTKGSPGMQQQSSSGKPDGLTASPMPPIGETIDNDRTRRGPSISPSSIARLNPISSPAASRIIV